MITIIPKPLRACENNQSFVFDSQLAIYCEFEEKTIQKLFETSFDFAPKISKQKAKFAIINDKQMGEEEYSATVKNDGIKISASSTIGVFYAFKSLRQISKFDGKNWTVQGVSIEDKPRFEYRGFMMDEARHFFGKEFVKKTLKMMSMIKLNTFHWHLTDDQGWRVEIKKYPLLTEKGSVRNSTQLNLIGYNSFKEKRDDVVYGEGKFYTQEDIKEIVEYANSLCINIIPEIDMPGHLVSAISCYPYLSCEGNPIDVSNRWGVMDTIGCVGNDKMIEFVNDIIDEMVEIFPYKYFHIGGDEVPKKKWKTCPKCQAKIKQLGLDNENQLQGWFNNQILLYLKQKGKSLIGWNEILEATNLNNDTIVQWWTGSCKCNGVKKWIESGNKAILTNHAFVYIDHFYSMKDLRKTYSLDLKTVGLNENCEDRILGVETPQWTEYVRDEGKFEFNTYPRMQALAEVAWTAKENRNFEDFDERLQKFFELMKEKSYAHAPKEAYICKGFSGFKRKLKCGKEWLINPNSEYEYFKNK